MFFSTFIIVFIGVVIYHAHRTLKNSGQNASQNISDRSIQTDTELDYREFIGFPISPAMKKFNRESEISTALTAEFMRNQNMRRALQIKEERQDLVDQSRLF